VDIVHVKDVAVRERRVLLRVDFNVPIDDAGKVTDDTRIREALPTIEYLRAQGARVILMSHLGRPGGKRVHRLSLAPVAERLAKLLDTDVALIGEITGSAAREAVQLMAPGDVVLLENVRFYPGEEKNDKAFARELANLGDLYVNDAFGTAHRAHASTHGVAEHLPAVAGLLMHKEIEALRALRDHPRSPYVAILGGAKISDKLTVCRRLLDKVDVLMLGGGLANTFLVAMGRDVGNSLAEPNMVPEVRNLIAECKRKNVDLLMPLDVVVANTIAPSATTQVVDAGAVPRGWSIVDIGPRTVARYTTRIGSARTVFWNGPMGVMEIPIFSRGTEAIAQAMADQDEARTVAGGGESVEMIARLDVGDSFDHVSTGGGAALQYLAGDTLPALTLLERTGKTLRRPWIGGNWKMGVRTDQSDRLARAVASGVSGEDVDVVIFPTYTQLGGVVETVEGSPVEVGAQDCHWETGGSYTAGISCEMIAAVGATHTLVGHSECRRYFGDDNYRVAQKLRAALTAGLKAVLCVGEDAREGEDAGWSMIHWQLHRPLDGLSAALGGAFPWGERLVIAYEPVWAIGTGAAADPATVAETTLRIREEIARIFDPWAAESIRVVYGGSVDAKNAGEYVDLPSVDGVLVGGASTSSDAFLGIVEAIRETTGARNG